MKGIRIVFVFLLLVIFFMVTGCSSGGVSMETETSVLVRVKTLEFKGMKEFVSATGTVYAIKEASLKIEQAGDYRLNTNPRTKALFAMGDKVQQGEVIIVIDNPEFVNQVAIESKKLNYDISKREFEKQERIYKKGGITLRELSDAERSYIDAGYAYENAKLALAKLNITAPFNGIIVDLPYYSPKQQIEANTLVAKVMDFSRLYTDVTLPGKEMSRVSRGQGVIITNYNSPETLTGIVTQVSPSLDPESRMFKLRIEIDNKDFLLKPGMFTKVDIVVKEKESTMVIPREVILDHRGSKTVFIVQRGIALERRLEIGMSNRDEVEVLKGLEKDDRLVVQGFETLRHRSKVKVIK
jgi:RND family efflux transporter MFP subunit